MWAEPRVVGGTRKGGGDGGREGLGGLKWGGSLGGRSVTQVQGGMWSSPQGRGFGGTLDVSKWSDEEEPSIAVWGEGVLRMCRRLLSTRAGCCVEWRGHMLPWGTELCPNSALQYHAQIIKRQTEDPFPF